GDAVLHAFAHPPRAHRARARRGVLQGIRAAGREHARGDAVDARIARDHRVPPERPGGALPASPHGDSEVGRRLSARQRRSGIVSAMLPAEFADLESFAEAWCLASEPERWDKRLASSMAEIQALYDAVTPRTEAALDYLDRYALDDMPPEALNLMY